MKNLKAFTLSETMIVVVVLGIIATLTIPALVNKSKESVAKTKVRKAMAAYESALNQMIIDNDVKGSLNTVEGFRTTDNCSESTKYFKKVEETSACKFKTADRIWWDISDIENPIIAFKEGDLTSATAGETDTKKAFYLIGRRDDNGILRINDKGYEDSITSGNDTRKAEMAKLYNFINNIEDSSGGDVNPFAACTEFPCEVDGLNWKGKINISQADADAAKDTKNYFCIWDPENNSCDKYDEDPSKNTSTAEVGDLFISDKLTLNAADAKSAENCATSRYSSCTSRGDYWNLARRTCEEAGKRLPTAAELKAMYNKGQLDSDSNYWAAEADSKYTSYAYYFNTPSGNVYGDGVTYYDVKAVCVGN